MKAEGTDTGGRIAEVLVASLAVTVTLLTAAGFGWYRSASRKPSLDRLTTNERHELVEEALARSPGIYADTWFQPQIGYTLKPGTELEAWNDRFRSNTFGYRSGPVPKKRGAFRILFVGDSWTYGMGIREEEAFPRVLAALANEHGGVEGVESWTLALPGYQTSNQVAAFDFFSGRLEPDAVVWVPSTNDSDSSARVLTNGALHLGFHSGLDPFGRRHHTWYRLPWFCNSYEFLARWHLAFSQLRSRERRLGDAGIPTAFLYLARWYDPAIVHWLASEAGLRSRYAVVPAELTLGDWLTDLPNPHGNPAAHERYAQLLYRLLAPRLGWEPLPAGLLHPEIAEVPLFSRPPEDGEWVERSRELLDDWTRRKIPQDYVAGDRRELPELFGFDRRRLQWAGPGDAETGSIGPSTTVLVRPPHGARELEITLSRVDRLPAYYPLELEIAIPSPAGGTRQTVVVSDRGEKEQRFRVDLPSDVVPGAAVDVVLTPARVTAREDSLFPESARLLRIEAVR